MYNFASKDDITMLELCFRILYSVHLQSASFSSHSLYIGNRRHPLPLYSRLKLKGTHYREQIYNGGGGEEGDPLHSS